MLLSMVGTWMQSTALAWLVLTLSPSSVVLGIVNALNFLPSLFLSLFAGVMVDRRSKRSVLTLTQSLLALQAAILWFLVWKKWITLREVYVLTLFLGVVNAFDQPARQVFVTEMVPDEGVTNAIGMNSLLFNVARTIGPMWAGAMIAAAGLAPSFLLNAVSFLFVVGGFAFMRPHEMRALPTPQHVSFRADFKEAWEFVVRTPLVFALIIALFFSGLFGFNFSTLIPLLAKFTVHGGPRTLGVFSSVMGAGSMVGALAVAGRPRPTNRILYVSGALFSMSEAAIIVSGNYFWITTLLAAMGFFGIVYLVATNALLQLESPAHMRTRVISLYVLLLVGITPFGAFITGVLAERFGVVWTMCAEGCLSLGGLVLSAVYLKRTPKTAIF